MVSWPLLIHGIPDLSSDGPDHARYDSNFASQIAPCHLAMDLYNRGAAIALQRRIEEKRGAAQSSIYAGKPSRIALAVPEQSSDSF
jgi:hypothetical protein